MSRSRRLHSAITAAGGLAVAAVLAATQSGSPSAPAALARSALARSAPARPALARPALARSAPAQSAGHAGPVSIGTAHHPPGHIAAYAAELANGITGKQLWGRRQYSPRPMASITKVMTALVVLRSGHLSRRITITAADEAYLGCCIQGAGLVPGDVLTARQLLYPMLLPSGADAAAALAGSFGPGWSAFIAKMNATARKLHLVGTHFTSFDGVQPSTVSTPRNLLLLGEAAMRHTVFRAVVRRRWYRIAAGPHTHHYLWQNTNLLLGHYPGVIGIKTGWIPQAGECLLFEATHGKRELIGVVLDSAPTKTGAVFSDAARLLNWGFGLHEPVPASLPPGRIPAE